MKLKIQRFTKPLEKILFISSILKKVVWHLRELIPRPKSKMDFYVKGYLVPCQTSVMEFLVKMVNNQNC